MRVFGYRVCGIFFHRIFIIDDQDRLFYKGSPVPWSRIIAYKRNDDVIGYLSRRPRTRFYLDDGSGFTATIWLEEEGSPPKPYFALIPRPTDAYRDFVELLRQRSGAQNLQDTPAGRFEGLWLASSVGAQAIGALVYGAGLNFSVPLPIFLIPIGALSALGGFIAQRKLQRRYIRRIRPTTRQE